MTRKKVKLAYITNDSTRKATFKKRKKGLIKKVGELSTLCDIDACAIVYSPYDAQPEVYPSPLGVQRVLTRFKQMPEMEQSKKMVNQESFLRQRITKANEQLKKQRKDNREKEITRVMFQSLTGANALQDLSILDLNNLDSLIKQNLKDINKRMERIGGIAMQQPQVMAEEAQEEEEVQEEEEEEEEVEEEEEEEEVKSDEEGTALVAVAAKKPPTFEANMGGMPQWFINLISPPK